jgi:hypothetical protein
MCGRGDNVVFRSSIFSTTNLFDENLRMEDLRIFCSVLRGAFALVYEPAAAVHHRRGNDCSALRRKLYRWGLGYVRYLAQVTCTDPAYRRKARSKIIAWFYPSTEGSFVAQAAQARRADLPLSLIIAEIVGGAR